MSSVSTIDPSHPASFGDPEPQSSTTSTLEVLFIDAAVEHSAMLAASVAPTIDVIVLDAHRDGIAQITAALKERPQVAIAHLIAHGAPGSLSLGNTELSLATLDRYATQLQAWFSQPASLLIYGCQVAAGDAGSEFVAQLHQLTGAAIAASSTLIGDRTQGGNWELDVQTQPMDVALALPQEVQERYPAVLAFTAFNPSTEDPQTLVDRLVASGTPLSVVADSITFVGADGQASFYDGTLTELGIGAGILLTSGDGTPPLTNTQSSYGEAQLGTNDPDLQAVANSAFVSAGENQDVNILQFSFIIDNPDILSVGFNLLFGSDEFPEFSNSSFVDVAAVFVNGVNVGLFNNNVNQPLSIIDTNLEVGNFINNGEPLDFSIFNGQSRILPIEYDGVSSPLSIFVPVQQGLNTIKFAVADTGDQIYDSGLLISNMTANTFSAENFSGVLLTLNGTDGDDIITGSVFNEFIDGGLGNDQVNAAPGNDIVNAGDGNDLIFTGDGNDEVNGGNGDDTINGELGNDILRGQVGNDTVSGGLGDDRLVGGEGDDSLSGNEDNDTINAGDGNDSAFGGDGDDRLLGLLGDDLLDGGNGNDTAEGGAGNDELLGLGGNDTLVGEDGNDAMTGGTGNDFLQCGAGNDTANGGNGKDKLFGDDGNDLLIGGKDSDRYRGGQGRDTFVLATGKGRDVILDFQDGRDKIQLSRRLGFSDLTLTQKGRNVIITDGNDQLAVLIKVDVDDLSGRDFRRA
ncbi:MAG: DUF4347 domain-containing protein [Synechococcales bacterium]|nr:DUF4347 domain-containing protein [Synechococcales bacterium]